jgi:hypothetical protein
MAALASAQKHEGFGWKAGFPPNAPQTAGQQVTVSGNLTVIQGRIGVKDNDITYHVRGLNRFVGFIDDLKDGAEATLEGYALTYPLDDKIKFLRVTKLTLNGKDYDLSPPPRMGPYFGRRR